LRIFFASLAISATLTFLVAFAMLNYFWPPFQAFETILTVKYKRPKPTA
jgi:hypothetical protein